MFRLALALALLLPAAAAAGSLEIGAAAGISGISVTSNGSSVDPSVQVINVFASHISATSGPAGTVTLALVTDAVTSSVLAPGAAGASGAELANTVSNVSGDLTITPVGTNLVLTAGKVLKVDTLTAAGASTALALLENTGVFIGNESVQGGTFTGSASTLTLNVDGSGEFILSVGDTFKADTLKTSGGGALSISETSGISLKLDAGTNGSTLVPSSGALDVDADGANGLFRLATGDLFSVTNITGNATAVKVRETSGLQISDDSETANTVSTLTPTGSGSDGRLTFSSAGAGQFIIGSGESLLVDSILATGGGAIAIKETSGISLQLDAGTNGSTLVPSSAQLAINVDGTGTLAIAAGDSLAVDSESVDSITGRTGATALKLNETTGIQMAQDANANASTWTPSANSLALDVNGTGTLSLATGDTFSVTNVTGNGTAVKLKETSGIQFSDDAETASNISLWTPSANTLTLAIAGTGTLVIDSTDGLSLDRATGNGGTLKLRETSGVEISDDSGTAATITTLTATSNTFTIGVAGSGAVVIAAGDTLNADTVQAATANGNITIKPNGSGTQVVIPTDKHILLTGQAGTPTSFAVGGLSYDTTRKNFVLDADQINAIYPVGLFFNQTSDSAAVTTLSATTVFTNTSSGNIAASSLPSAKVVRVIAAGTAVLTGATSPTVAINLQYGSTIVATSGTVTLPNGTYQWYFDATLGVNSPGATANLRGVVFHNWAQGAVGAPVVSSSNSGAFGTFDTTSSQAFKMSVSLGAGSGAPTASVVCNTSDYFFTN